jgi:UDP-glucose 4-epimerase
MRIAVTGGAGFLGQATVNEAAAQGHDVWRFDRSDGDDILGNLHSLQGADCVIHLAGILGTAELFDNPDVAIDMNIHGALRVLQWCRFNNARYVGITMPDSNWANVYQATKLAAGRLASAWHRNFGVPVSHVRAFNAFGPGQKHGPGHPQKFLPTFAWHAWRGKPIPVWGDGLQTVAAVHVDDVARILVQAVQYGHDETFDAGPRKGVTVKEFAQAVNLYCGQPMDNIEYLPMRPGETEHTDIHAEGEGWDLLGWEPELDWAKVEEAVNWYKP